MIVDEAHSSQSGGMTKSLKQVPTSSSLEEAEREEELEMDMEDQVVAEMKSRGPQKNVSTFRLLRAFVELHDHAIREKVRIMAEHFHQNVAHRINGRAKAMIVTRSRLHAIRYHRALERYLTEQGYDYDALVAFSGTVRDGPEGKAPRARAELTHLAIARFALSGSFGSEGMCHVTA